MNFLRLTLIALVLGGCTTLGNVAQVSQDEKLLPPTSAAIADAYGAIQVAAALGQQVCMVDHSLPADTCKALQLRLVTALSQVRSIDVFVQQGFATPAQSSVLAEAQSAIQAVITALQAAETVLPSSAPKV
jgi:hypothetical protein